MQQVELQVKRRMGIGSFLSERRLIDEIMRTGLGESTVSLLCSPLVLRMDKIKSLLALLRDSISYNIIMLEISSRFRSL